jgi:hypothetical protein
MAVKKALNSNGLIGLEQALKPLTDSNLIVLEKFDANKHSAKKYRVTLKNGKVETASDLREIIDECFDPSEVRAWASDAFDSNPTIEQIETYISRNEELFLSDFGCKVEEYFE